MITISVCIATYNGEKYISEQLSSILPQLGVNDEIVISDDNSTDNTLQLIKNIKDDRIKIFKNTLPPGYSSNFENSINKAKGDVIFLSDQDDVWMDNKVQVMMKSLINNDLVISDAVICNAHLIPTFGSHFKIHGTKKGFINNWIKTRYIGACMAFRRVILDKLLPFPENKKLCAHDYWIAIAGEYFYKVDILNIPLIKYRRHDENATTGGDKSQNFLIHKIKVRIYSLKELIKRT